MSRIPIPSPYNFVPLSDRVFFPPWAAQVSHDIPFSDGISGWFDIEVEALTPIYIRNGTDLRGQTDKERQERMNNLEWLSFFRIKNGPFAIPGTEIKGMLRNVVEIATFSIMPQIDKRRYGYRDLNNEDPEFYRGRMSGGNKPNGFYPLAKPGWLHLKHDDSFEIFPCEMARVEQVDLECFAGANPQEEEGFLGSIRREEKNAREASRKYKEWEQKRKSRRIQFDIGKPSEHTVKLLYKRAINIGNGNTTGTLVFTGQPVNRQEYDRGCWWNPDKRKHMEFVFYARKPAAIPVSSEVADDFKFIHSDERDKSKDNDDLTFLKSQYEITKDGIPVFYLSDNTGKVTAIGLALMFRLPYNTTADQLASKQQTERDNKKDLDFAETLFGRTSESDSLKGRIQIETLLDQNETCHPFPNAVEVVLNSPKPTYYPNYLNQPSEKHFDLDSNGALPEDTLHYATWLDDGSNGRATAQIRGWKRYICREDGDFQTKDSNPSKNKKITTKFIPLEKGCKFRGRIHFHNLRKAEIGALLWALTWGNNNSLRHRLGMAKPYGFGHVKVTFPKTQPDKPSHHIFGWSDKIQIPTDDSSWETFRAECIDSFRKLMDNWCTDAERKLGKWEDTPQIRALIKLATPVRNPDKDWHHPVEYPPNPQAFAKYKKDRLALLPVLELSAYSTENKPAKPSVSSAGSASKPQPPPKPLPDLTGQLRQVSFKHRLILPKNKTESVFFCLKVDKERYDARLDNPQRTDVCDTLKIGDSFKLYVVGSENGVYILAEKLPSEAGD
jgi:CRISPR-associated protein (TIGR03986 family)